MSEQIPDRSLHEDSNSQHPSLGVRLPASSAYGAMKAAVETFTRYAAKEPAGRKITANVIAPGAIATDFSGGMVRGWRHRAG
jgi:NAD(P)-dependent dehydrogenase (short-subunit alcohol dehydrogenase family)